MPLSSTKSRCRCWMLWIAGCPIASWFWWPLQLCTWSPSTKKAWNQQQAVFGCDALVEVSAFVYGQLSVTTSDVEHDIARIVGWPLLEENRYENCGKYVLCFAPSDRKKQPKSSQNYLGKSVVCRLCTWIAPTSGAGKWRKLFPKLSTSQKSANSRLGRQQLTPCTSSTSSPQTWNINHNS